MGAILANPIVVNLIVAGISLAVGHITGWFHHKKVVATANMAAKASMVPPKVSPPK